MATNLGTLYVDELFVAGRRVSEGTAPAALMPSLPVARLSIADSEATNIKSLVADFNMLLAALRAAGVLAEE